jgi:HK97 family phage major capsid protein
MVSSPGGSPETWGGAFLAYPPNLAAEFVELLYPMTILGKMNGWRRIPFNVRVGVQSGGSTVNWVGEGDPKPVTELEFTEALMTYSKIAGIVVLTEELVRLSTPAAEATVRSDLTRSIAKFIDQQMLDASVTATDARPASLTNGVAAVAATGYDADALYQDLNDALAAYDSSETGTDNIYLVVRPSLSRGISTMRNALGQFEFTGVNPQGGTLNGFPLIVSNSAPADTIVLVKTDEVFLADDGGVTIDASREATLDMAGSTSPNFSLFQRNCVAIRAERWIRWQKRRSSAVQLITGALYNPSGTSPA